MNLPNLLRKVSGLTLVPPEPKFAMAAMNDFLLSGGWQPLSESDWSRLFNKIGINEVERKALADFSPPFHLENLGWLALFGRELGLFDLARTGGAQIKTSAELLQHLFVALRGLPPSLVSTSVFRQEEMIRRWLDTFEVPIDGESAAQSRNSIQRLDYLKTLVSAAEADVVLQKRLKEREKALAALRRQEQANRRANYE